METAKTNERPFRPGFLAVASTSLSPSLAPSLAPSLVLALAPSLALALALFGCAKPSPSIPRQANVTPTAAATPRWSDDEAAVPTTSDDPMWGDRDAPVTMIEFADFQCHFCALVTPTLDHLKEAYGPHKLRIIWKNLPLEMHPQARGAAEAAQGVFALAGSDAFWKFHDSAFRGSSPLTRESYSMWATQAGVKDVAAFRAGLDHGDFSRKVSDDLKLAEVIGVGGTPSFFVNAVFINGAERFDKFKRIIDRELEKAEAALAHGTPRDRVYVAMSRKNAENPSHDVDDPEEEEDSTTVWKIPGDGVARGPSTALVTIVEFGDYEDRYTRRVEPTMAALRSKYGADLRVVWKDEPLPHHKRAPLAANLALEARKQRGDAAFWEAHDLLLAAPDLEETTLAGISTALGLDGPKALEAMQTNKHAKEIDADLDRMDDFEAMGTPYFFIDGRKLMGAHPQKRFEQMIDEELAKAKALLAGGTAREGVYAALVKDGKPPPPQEVKTLAISKTAPWKGSETAKVTVEIFSDFQCPFCSRVEPTLREVMKVYGTRIRLAWRNLPLPMHADAPLAAQAAMEAFRQKGADAFWKIHDEMFEHQDDLKRATLDGYAVALGLDMEKWKVALDTEANKPAIDAEAKLAEAAEIHGTPAFIVHVAGSPSEARGEGYFISGAHPYAKFRKVIERALAEAK